MKKARAWLAEHAVEYEFHDYKKAGLEEETLREWISKVGWEVLLNRRGTTWRKVPQEVRDSIDENSAVELMLANTSMIKRPVIKHDEELLVGFDEEEYSRTFS